MAAAQLIKNLVKGKTFPSPITTWQLCVIIHLIPYSFSSFPPHPAHTGTRIIPDEQRLLNKMFRNYDNSVRPVYNATKNVVVKFGLTLIQVMDMVSTISPALHNPPR